MLSFLEMELLLFFLLILLTLILACFTLNFPMSDGLNNVCLFKFETSTLSKSTIPILPTPDATK